MVTAEVALLVPIGGYQTDEPLPGKSSWLA